MAFVTSFLGAQLSRSHQLKRNSVCSSRQLSSSQIRASSKKKADSQSKIRDGFDEAWVTGKIRAPRQQRGGGRRLVRPDVKTQGKWHYSSSLPPSPPGLRVSSGSARGRRVISPNVYLRPMMAKVREAVFNMLDMLRALRSDGTCLDLFAGSGSVGIEALSRGMSKAVFVDYSRECVDSVNENLNNCKFSERGTSVCVRVEEFLRDGSSYNSGRHYDLITITPPYEEVNYAKLMKSVANSDCVGEGTFVVVEYPTELQALPPSIEHRLVGIRNRRYGRTVIAVYACQPDLDVIARPHEFIDFKKK